MVDNPVAPNETLMIKVAGQDRELFMSFGMLHELLPVVGDLVRIGLISVDTSLRAEVLNTVLAPRNENGIITEPINMFMLRVSTADVQRIITWVQEHLLDFFLAAIENATKVHLPHLDRLKAPTSMPSGTGSSD